MLGSDYAVRDNLSYIDGKWTGDGELEPLGSPASGDIVARIHQCTPSDTDRAVESAAMAFKTWRNIPSYQRSALISRLADGARVRNADLTGQMVAETGKPIREARQEVDRSVSTLEVSAEEAKRVLGETIAMDAVKAGEGKIGFTIRVPMGVVAAITPFNAPLNTLCHKLGPALAAGNTVVAKPHVRGGGVAAIMAEIAAEAGIPPGVFNLVQGGSGTGRRLTMNAEVAFINFTGSGRIAQQIQAEAGLKKTLLELGGNAPTIVHHDADLNAAVPQIAEASFGLTGQSCISTQRILVHEAVADTLESRLAQAARERRIGDPWDEATRLGPLIDAGAADRVEAWVAEAVALGAEIVCGGTRKLNYFDATVLKSVRPDMRICAEEVFGPVVSLIRYSDINNAIEQANATPWGLKVGVFTNSLDVALQAARELEFGTVNINGASRARVDHEPSGGVKMSGWGKEGPRYAIREMTNERMIAFHPSPPKDIGTARTCTVQ